MLAEDPWEALLEADASVMELPPGHLWCGFG
jgi:hypothetical protein